MNVSSENGRGHRRTALVQSLLADVFSGRLRAGEHLVTDELANRFGVSHTPIREALISLAGIGVIELLPNRGAVVRRISAREVCEVCQVRRVLECEAARTACGRIDLGELDDIARGLRRLGAVKNPGPAFIVTARELDTRLHDLIASSCGNTFLANEIGRLRMLFHAFRDMAWDLDASRHDYRRLSQESGEHLAIVDALRAGDGKTARKAMATHIRSGVKYWTRALPERTESNEKPATRPKKRSR